MAWVGSETVPGKPIVNSIKESLVMLDTLPDLDYVLIEDTAGLLSTGTV